MKNEDGKLTYYMRWVAGATAILIAYGSAKLSVVGIGLGGDLWWLNWTIAVSLFVAEFMVNGKHKELNWMILLVGIGAYSYSIATNIAGIGNYMGEVSTVMDKITMYAGGFFMDIYPELVLRWALGESKVGDLLGNLVKTYQEPETLLKSFSVQSVPNNTEYRQHVNREERQRELEEKYRKNRNEHQVQKQVPKKRSIERDEYPTYHLLTRDDGEVQQRSHVVG